MPQITAGQHSYVRPVKIYVDSDEALASLITNGEYNYKVQLAEHLTNVIGIELTAFNIPNNIAPTFLAAQGTIPGNNKFDFTLDDGGVSSTFTVTWPSNSYTYENVVTSWTSYIDALVSLLSEAVVGDVNFDGVVEFTASSDPNERTIINVRSLAPYVNTDDVSLTFLFATGASVHDTAADVMGFAPGVDYVSASASNLQQVISPLKTDLQPFRYIDIFVRQAPEHLPLQRVYFRNLLYYGTAQNDTMKPVRILGTAIPKLRELDIKLTLKNGRAPLSVNRPHDLTFTVYVISSETTVPDYVKQIFTL